jgi:enoyl-[acyl-carrier-protein] reductase (NADH)
VVKFRVEGRTNRPPSVLSEGSRLVADAVLFLLSSKAASITGQALFVDAGSSA